MSAICWPALNWKMCIRDSRIYEGLEFFAELDTLAAQSVWLLEEFGLDFHCVVERYCRNGSTYISKAVPDAEELLKKLWSLYHEPMPFAVMQMKIYSLALFSLLMAQKEIPPSQVCAYFTETQVSIAKQVEQIITADLRQYHPAWELAARFSISETSMTVSYTHLPVAHSGKQHNNTEQQAADSQHAKLFNFGEKQHHGDAADQRNDHTDERDENRDKANRCRGKDHDKVCLLYTS